LFLDEFAGARFARSLASTMDNSSVASRTRVRDVWREESEAFRAANARSPAIFSYLAIETRAINYVKRVVDSLLAQEEKNSIVGRAAPGERRQKRAARRARCTTAECRTFQRKNANEQIAPGNWGTASPRCAVTSMSAVAITAESFPFRPALVRDERKNKTGDMTSSGV